MLSNLFDQIFGRSKCGKREIITTTIIEPDSININDADDPRENDSTDAPAHCCFLPSFSLSGIQSESNTLQTNYESQPQHKQLTTEQRSVSEEQQQQKQQQLHNNHHQNHQNHQHRLPSNLHNQNRIRNNQNKLNEISIFSVYLLFATLFVCICTIAVLLFTYINRANDIVQLRDSLTSEFIVRSDIDELIRNVLREIKTTDDGSFYVDSNEDSSSSSSSRRRQQNTNNMHEHNNNNDIRITDGSVVRWVNTWCWTCCPVCLLRIFTLFRY